MVAWSRTRLSLRVEWLHGEREFLILGQTQGRQDGIPQTKTARFIREGHAQISRLESICHEQRRCSERVFDYSCIAALREASVPSKDARPPRLPRLPQPSANALPCSAMIVVSRHKQQQFIRSAWLCPLSFTTQGCGMLQSQPSVLLLRFRVFAMIPWLEQKHM